MEIYTVGFAKKSAEQFFRILRDANIARLVDVRLNNVSQLAGFTKREDLRFFLSEIEKIDYVHEPLLAPTKEILDDYRKRKGGWANYERAFAGLLVERQVEKKIDQELFAVPSILLCSEPTAARCHRRLVAEYLREKWGGVEIKHL